MSDAGGHELVLDLDQGQPGWLTCVGRKGSGKSYLAQRFFDGWEGDKLVIDPTGDVVVADIDGKPAETLSLPLPASWPTRGDGKPSTLRFVPDVGADTWLDDMDRAVGLAFNRGRCLLWIDEVGELTRATYTPPNMRRLLRQFRHRKMWVLACDPRPVDISPLVISQADYIGIFDLPHPRDRERCAAVMGMAPKDFDAAHEEIWRPPKDASSHQKWTGFIWYDSIRRTPTIMPPLPARRRPEGQRFADDDEPGPVDGDGLSVS
jgi:hypothetical protein